MGTIRILNESQLRDLVPLDLDAVACVENAFKILATGRVVMPPVLSMPIEDHNGEVDVKTAYVPGLASFAVKMSPGFFDNPKLGLPSTTGLMVLFCAQTGGLEALLLDNGYLTDVRTAAAGAVAARLMARADARRACIVGAGMQARLQLQALALVRPIDHAEIWARDGARAADCAAELGESLGIRVNSSEDLETSVRAADVIVTTTPSTIPLVMADWLKAGQHVTAMGSDQAHKNEIDLACLKMADLYVPDKQSQTRILGELRSAIDVGLVASDETFAELGELAAGQRSGRTGATDITIADLTGTGVQDTAIATLARERAQSNNVGTAFDA
ncbi:MAG: ectoine utilization protein EutC [Devosia sp.]